MFTSCNLQLIRLIENSAVIAHKLSTAQQQKFLHTALSLPEKMQNELLQKLKNEQSELQEKISRNAHKIKKYEKTVQTLIKQEKQNLEKTVSHSEKKYSEHLLQQL